MSDERLSVLHEHHKDSFALIHACERQRDRLFLWVIVLLGLLFLEIGYPANVRAAVQEIGGVKLDAAALPWLPIVSATWAMLLAISLRYFQLCVCVERKYDYLHDLESRLSALYGDDGVNDCQYQVFTRESNAYLDDYPLVGEWVWILYTIVFPALTILAMLTLWRMEYASNTAKGYLCFDGIVAAIITATIGLYRVPQIATHPWTLLKWMSSKVWKSKPVEKPVESTKAASATAGTSSGNAG